MKTIIILFLLIMNLCLSGCMHPQIVDPYSTGFSKDEYLVIKAIDYDQLGQLCWGKKEFDKDNKLLPFRWTCGMKLIFPSSDVVNKVQDLLSDTQRYAFETVGNSAKFTAAAIVNLDTSTDSAYKFESKSEKVKRFNMTTLSYAQPAADFMKTLLTDDTETQFAYLSAIYYGTAFVETLKNNNTNGGGSYAAFQIGDSYYSSTNKHLATTGPIIYQLTMLDPREVNIVVPHKPSLSDGFKEIIAISPDQVTPANKLNKIPEDTLQKIKSQMPLEHQKMLE